MTWRVLLCWVRGHAWEWQDGPWRKVCQRCGKEGECAGW